MMSEKINRSDDAQNHTQTLQCSNIQLVFCVTYVCVQLLIHPCNIHLQLFLFSTIVKGKKWTSGGIKSYVILSMRLNIYIVYKTPRSCNALCLILLHNIRIPFLQEVAEIRVTMIPQESMVDGL